MFGAYEVEFEKGKLGLAILFFGACAAFSYHLLFNQPPELVSYKWRFLFKDTHQAAIFCLIIFVPFILLNLKNFLSSKPVVVIDSRGIYDSRHVKDIIPWSDIVSSGTQSMDFLGVGMDVLGIELTASGRQNVRLKWFYHMNAWYYRTGDSNIVCFHLNGLNYDGDEFINALHSQRTVRAAQTPQRNFPPRSGNLFN